MLHLTQYFDKYPKTFFAVLSPEARKFAVYIEFHATASDQTQQQQNTITLVCNILVRRKEEK